LLHESGKCNVGLIRNESKFSKKKKRWRIFSTKFNENLSIISEMERGNRENALIKCPFYTFHAKGG
jgi:hypothetical protein